MGTIDLKIRTFELTTPLGANVLMFHHMTATEELGRLADYQLDALSESGEINPDDILGKSVTVKMELPEGGNRYFSAYVIRFGLVGMEGRYYKYHAILKPWMWFLTRTKDCRIYQNKTAPEIIKEVFEEHSIAKYKLDLTESYRTREYCVQYRESDFEFISRLMEEEGIYYYFNHDENGDTAVLADSYAAHAPLPHYEKIPFMPKGQSTRPEREHISTWSCEREIRPGKYVLHDFDFEKPSANLSALTSQQRDHGLADYEIFDYPGSYTNREDGEKYARIRMEELHARHELVNADSNARGIAVGRLFTLSDHPRNDQNREYLVVKAAYELHGQPYETDTSGGASFVAHITGLQSKQPFRTQQTTPKPAVLGPQTAIVVGPEEIYTDKHGRVKAQFHWDRYGKNDENSSCWIRVSQNWGGKGWGGMFIPHVGQEVIVEFLEGDPDRPLITGRVYNAENRPPMDLPAGKAHSVIRDHGGNEIVMQGTPGDQRLRLHSPRHNSTVVLGNSITMETESVVKAEAKDNITLQSDRTISETAAIGYSVSAGGGIYSLSAGAADPTVPNSKAGFNVTVKGPEAVYEYKNGLKVDINQGEKHTILDGDFTQDIKAGLATIKSSGELKLHSDADVVLDAPANNIRLDAGKKVLINAPDGHTVHTKQDWVNTPLDLKTIGRSVKHTRENYERRDMNAEVRGVNIELRGVHLSNVAFKAEKVACEIANKTFEKYASKVMLLSHAVKLTKGGVNLANNGIIFVKAKFESHG
ncbi:MAG: type VI secretion system tip protein VgrG [Gammaproteobacteria bacterium]|nr:type VI secretion system tip protein VgrG [Gammaproteobacteria bacterium]